MKNHQLTYLTFIGTNKRQTAVFPFNYQYYKDRLHNNYFPYFLKYSFLENMQFVLNFAAHLYCLVFRITTMDLIVSHDTRSKTN